MSKIAEILTRSLLWNNPCFDFFVHICTKISFGMIYSFRAFGIRTSRIRTDILRPMRTSYLVHRLILVLHTYKWKKLNHFFTNFISIWQKKIISVSGIVEHQSQQHRWQLNPTIFNWRADNWLPGLPDFSGSKHTKRGKIYQMAMNYTKRP
jgi:hypothetical protein